MKQRQGQPRSRQQPDTAQATSFESAPWSPRELVLEEPRSSGGGPLRLEQNDHVVDVELDGAAILRQKL